MSFEDQCRHVRTGDLFLSATSDLGDAISFIFRLGSYCHSHICVWYDYDAYQQGEFRVVPKYTGPQTKLGIMGMARQRAYDLFTRDYCNGLIVYEPNFYQEGLTQLTTRGISRKNFSDQHMATHVQEFLTKHSLTKFAFSVPHLLAIGARMNLYGPQKGYLCSELVYKYLEYTTGYPKIDNIKELHPDEIIPEAPSFMYTPDMFSDQLNNHPIFEQEENLFISRNEQLSQGILHPYIITIVIAAIICGLILIVIIKPWSNEEPVSRKFESLRYIP